MYAAISSDAPDPSTTVERMDVDIHNETALTVGSDSHCDHDPTLLVRALEEIEARRAGLEWLIDSDLLFQCLI